MTGLESVAVRLAQKGVQAAAQRLVELQQEQLTELRAINARLNAVLVAPYKAGRRHLESALQDGMSDESTSRELEKARDRFIDAYDQLDHDPLTQSHVAIMAAGTALLLDYPTAENLRWLGLAHDSSAVATFNECRDFNARAKRMLGPMAATPRIASLRTRGLRRDVEPTISRLYEFLEEIYWMRFKLGIPHTNNPRYLIHRFDWEYYFYPASRDEAFQHAHELRTDGDEPGYKLVMDENWRGMDLLKSGDLIAAKEAFNVALGTGSPTGTNLNITIEEGRLARARDAATHGPSSEARSFEQPGQDKLES